jgi:RND family efflux transporter MFP subunit
MKKFVIVAVVVAIGLAGVAFYTGIFSRQPAEASSGQGGPGGGDAPRRQGGGAGGFGSGGQFARAPMTVELGTPSRANVTQQFTVVGNLVGEATVAVVPKVAGRLEEVYVKLGDRVARGQRIARIEDQELREQVKQAQAAYDVSRATIRQREADLKFAETNLERSRNLFERQLLPRQTMDDADARHQAAVAQVDLARAQFAQSQARLDELRITLANTTIVSPVNGFVARRAADPGAYVSQNAPVVDVVDISLVRLVANIVEKDLRQIQSGESAAVEVDAFPGEKFAGRIARVAPVLDPATRTASIEIEIPNPGFRLKPGMYARVELTVAQRNNALTVPSNSLVDLDGQRGVFLAQNDKAAFRPVEVGIEEAARVEILSGVEEGDPIITTGAAALRDGGWIVLAGQGPGGGAGSPGRQRPPSGQRQGQRGGN